MSGNSRILLVAIMLGVVGCMGGSLVVKTPPHPPGFPHSALTAPVPTPTPPSSLSGSLPNALDQMSGKDLYDFIAAMPRGKGVNAERKCKGFSCWLSGGKVIVGIEAAADARWLNGANAGVNGTVAALVKNKGKYKTARYGFDPDENSKHHTYAFIVFPGGLAGGPKYVLEDIVRDGNVYSHQTVQAGNFILCNHDTWWDESVAAFQSCEGLMSKSVVGTGIVTMGFDLLAIPKALLAVAQSARLAYAADDTPGWISCAAGCCTMGAALTD